MFPFSYLSQLTANDLYFNIYTPTALSGYRLKPLSDKPYKPNKIYK